MIGRPLMIIPFANASPRAPVTGAPLLLIGDGRLNYGHEWIFETYYAYAIDKSFTLTADYQLITNPAYNADRGPVHIFSGRLQGVF
jgi:high affinity Mn2+ porin